MKPSDILTMNFPPIILIYGDFGTGKTGLVTQLSGAYGFDFDGGMRTAATLKDKFFSDRQKVEFDVFRETNPFKPTKYKEAMIKLKDIHNKCSKKIWDRDAVVVDSLTGLCTSAQLYIQSLGDVSNPSRDPMAKMEIQNWGSLVSAVDRFLLILQSLQVPIIVTAHTDYGEIPIKGKLGKTQITSIFPSSATSKHGKKKLGSRFDEIWFADKRPAGGGKMSYRVTGESFGIEVARTRSSFKTVIHNEMGMVELLKKIGYEYQKKALKEKK